MAHPHLELAAQLQREAAHAHELQAAHAHELQAAHRDHGWECDMPLATFHQRRAADRSSLARQLMNIE